MQELKARLNPSEGRERMRVVTWENILFTEIDKSSNSFWWRFWNCVTGRELFSVGLR
jgi:hypothetical protein